MIYIAVFFGILTLSIFMRNYIAVAVFLTAVLAVSIFLGPDQLRTIASIAFTSTYSWELTSLPLFIFMGTLMLHTGISRRLFNGFSGVCSYLPGGLQQINILFSAVFAAMTGSGSAGIATLTTVAAPEFEKRPQYRMYNVYGSIAGGSVLSTTIPPSVPLIIYGALVGESIGALFIAGIVPGVIEGGTQMIYIAVESLLRREGRLETPAPIGRVIIQLLGAWPAVILIGLALVTIYTGIATPAEGGALGAFGATVIGMTNRELDWKKMMTAAYQTIFITGMFGLSYIGARVYSFAASSLYLPQILTNYFLESNLGVMGLVIMFDIMGFILGMFGGTTMMLLVVAPIVYPVFQATAFESGWTGIWLGIQIVFLLDQGALTPPIGGHVFVISAFTKRANEYIFKGTWPYTACIWATIIITTIWPQVVTWLPSTMMTAGG